MSDKKNKKLVSKGNVYIQASFNNTIITVTDLSGNTIAWSTSGSVGFKGSKKSTPYASQLAASSAIEKAMNNYSLKEVDVFVSGPGIGRESSIRALAARGITIRLIKDVTPLPHNGCRPRKRRRV